MPCYGTLMVGQARAGPLDRQTPVHHLLRPPLEASADRPHPGGGADVGQAPSHRTGPPPLHSPPLADPERPASHATGPAPPGGSGATRHPAPDPQAGRRATPPAAPRARSPARPSAPCSPCSCAASPTLRRWRWGTHSWNVTTPSAIAVRAVPLGAVSCATGRDARWAVCDSISWLRVWPATISGSAGKIISTTNNCTWLSAKRAG